MKTIMVEKEKELKSLNHVKDIVFNYFSLSQKSYNLFESELTRRNIDEVYYEALKESNGLDDLRIRMPLTVSERSLIDKGYTHFKNRFARFCSDFNITYENFLENKVQVGQNKIKLKKALIKYNNELIENRPDYAQYTEGEKKIEEAKVYFNVEEGLRHVNNLSLPKSENVELVLSLNFSDWMLASTAETWSSCLSLDSETEGLYWAGLPGLIGDKNRALLYITNGEEKTYEGIKSYRMLFRTWVVLDTHNELNQVRWYPDESALNFKSFEQLKKYFTLTDTPAFWEAKRPISPILTNKDGWIALPFLDSTKVLDADSEQPELFYEKGLGGQFSAPFHDMQEIREMDLYDMENFEDNEEGLFGLTRIMEYDTEVIDFACY